jgi:hypothetical protein
MCSVHTVGFKKEPPLHNTISAELAVVPDWDRIDDEDLDFRDQVCYIVAVVDIS